MRFLYLKEINFKINMVGLICLYCILADAAKIPKYLEEILRESGALESKNDSSTNSSNTKTLFENCAVSTEVPMCSELGVEILKIGGNAMDSAIASAICVGIVNSFSSGIGGGGFILVKESKKKGGAVEMIDFRETAPRRLTNEYLENKINLTKVSGSAVGIPGEVRGFYMAHKKYGKLPWDILFEKNIEIAKGFPASEQLCRRLKKLETYIFADEGLRSVYTKNNRLLNIGDIVIRENYSKTLEKIAKDPESFYVGEIAQDIVKSVKLNGGVIELDDLINYKAISRQPLKGKYFDYTIYTTNLPTSGIFILLALNIMEKVDLIEIDRIGKETGEYPQYHLLIEIFKFMAAKRGELGDPDFLPNWKDLLEQIGSENFAQSIVEKIVFNKVLNFEEYGRKVEASNDHGTTHLNVIDDDEMTVLLTSTVNLEFGAKFMDEKTGIIFNDEIDDFYVPKVRNAFDLDDMSQNFIEPGKRPFSSAAPVIMMKHDEIIAIGAAGGTRIPTSIFSVIFHLILGRSISDAIMESRLHNQLVPKYTYIEYNLPKDIREYLQQLGHKIAVSSENSIFTSVQGIHVKKFANKKKRIEAFSDKRKGGLAAGY